MSSIVQWNCRGLNQEKKNSLKILIQDHDPIAICLQETKCKLRSSPKVNGFKSFFKNRASATIAHGGVGILVRDGFEAEEIRLNTDLQAIAVKLYNPSEFSLCNVYVSGGEELRERDVADLVTQLGENFIMLGDFNAHSPLWGGRSRNVRGRIIENVIDDYNLCIMNTGEDTHFSEASKTFSAIDLTLATSSVASLFNWEVEVDGMGSDHFPIKLKQGAGPNDKLRKKWNIEKADWVKFRESLRFEDLINNLPEDVEASENKVREVILAAAKASIPESSGKKPKKYAPWWNAQIAQNQKENRKLLRDFKRTRSLEVLERQKQKQNELKRLIKKAKAESWESFVSGVNNNTSTKELYEKVGKLSGKTRSSVVKALEVEGRNVTDPQTILENLAKSFSTQTSNESYGQPFRDLKVEREKIPLIVRDDDEQDYNQEFSRQELEAALGECTGSSPGPDGIHYQMLKNLTGEGKTALLTLYNKIWMKSQIPASWKIALAIPALKPGKDARKAENYRTIQLTNCLGKLLEKMVNRRLTWFLESEEILDEAQSGFRRNRSTMDNVVLLEGEIRETLENKEYLIAVSFDLMRAYDLTWRRKIIEELIRSGLKGRMVKYVMSLLEGRRAKMVMGALESGVVSQETGLVTGSVISVTLFLLMANVLLRSIPVETKKFMFADDLVIFVKGKNLTEMGNILQRTINAIQDKANDIGFSFSAGKTVAITFTRKTKPGKNPDLFLQREKIKYQNEHKILGVIFDRSLSWRSHVEYLAGRARKRLNILRMLSNVRYGVNRHHMITLHQSIILSVIDYGSIVYGNASKTTLKKLDTIHAAGLRIALGAFKSSPIESLLVEAGQMPLRLRREKQQMDYGIRVLTLENHPLHMELESWMEAEKDELAENNPSTIQKAAQLLREGKIVEDAPDRKRLQSHPPWGKQNYFFDFSLAHSKKNETSPTILKKKSLERLEKYKDCYKIFTDGSKEGDQAGWGFSSAEVDRKGKMAKGASVFSAELTAILNAVLYCRGLKGENFLICSDSQSALKAIEKMYAKNSLALRIKDAVAESGKSFLFLWIPSHVGIEGNEAADDNAKKGRKTRKTGEEMITREDLKNKSNGKSWQKWMRELVRSRNRVYRLRGKVRREERTQLSRRDAMIVSRLRIGHTRITHGYLMNNGEAPVCNCGENFTVDHIMDCQYADLLRNMMGLSGSEELKNLDESRIKVVIEYLKLIGLYYEI